MECTSTPSVLGKPRRLSALGVFLKLVFSLTKPGADNQCYSMTENNLLDRISSILVYCTRKHESLWGDGLLSKDASGEGEAQQLVYFCADDDHGTMHEEPPASMRPPYQNFLYITNT